MTQIITMYGGALASLDDVTAGPCPGHDHPMAETGRCPCDGPAVAGPWFDHGSAMASGPMVGPWPGHGPAVVVA